MKLGSGNAGNFVCARYGINPNLQEFNINKETQFVKIEFIDNWNTIWKFHTY